MAAETAERMPVRDQDLRAVVIEHGARPGDSLWSVLVELQKRRDAAADSRTAPSELARPGQGGGR